MRTQWLKSACENPQSPFRDWYVSCDEHPDDYDKGMVFPGTQKSTWTFNDTAGMWYFHRFYDHQPDLDTHNPTVRHEITKIMGYWLELGISGFRMDAAPFIVAKKGVAIPTQRDYGFLHELRQFLQWRCRDAVMLAEANVPPDESLDFFGSEGDRLQLLLNFPVNQRLFYAMATGDVGPLMGASADVEEARLGTVGQFPPVARRARSRTALARAARGRVQGVRAGQVDAAATIAASAAGSHRC